MKPLTIDMFITAAQDAEWGEYKLLAALKQYREEFNQNKLYPGMAELVEITSTLEAMLRQKEALDGKLPRQITGVDSEKNSLIYSKSADLLLSDSIFGFINFALPQLHEVLEEARTIYEFVEENILIKEVGIIPLYREEGYLLVPDLKKDLLHILRFELSLFTSQGEEMRLLKTQVVKELCGNPHDINSIKLDLVQEIPDLPNPATYKLETELDFPFKETLLPVAKRRLISHLAA